MPVGYRARLHVQGVGQLTTRKGEAVDGEAAQRGLGVKPGPAVLDLAAPIGHDEVLRSLRAGQVDGARRAQGSLEGRQRDDQLIRKLRELDFTGRLYEMFEAELVRYAISVLRAWMYSGHIFTLLAQRGFAMHPTEAELRELADDSEVRQDLATMTTAVALAKFRTRALHGAGWRVEGGASITTYFMGACLYAFPNEFRRRRADRRRHAQTAPQENAALLHELRQQSDPAALALGNLRVRDDLERLAERTRTVVELSLAGCPQAEIAERLGLESPRAVEGILYRWRTRQKDELREEGRDNA